MPAYKYKTNKGIKWYAKFSYINPVTQKREQKCQRGFLKEKEAKEYERHYLENINSPEFIAKQKVKNENKNMPVLFCDLYDEYFEHIQLQVKLGKISPNTVRCKIMMINQYILPFFSNYPIKGITEKHIEDWQSFIISKKLVKNNEKKLSNTYIYLIQTQLTAIFNFAVKRHYLLYSPQENIEKIGNNKAKEKSIWEPDEYLRFSEAAKQNLRSWYLFELYYWCGLRRGEGLGLTIADIHFSGESGYIVISKSMNSQKIIGVTKTESSNRTVWMPKSVAAEIKEHISTLYDPKPNDRLFNISVYMLYRDMEKAIKKSGVKKIHLHDLRHSFASVLINSNHFSIVDISKTLGHSKVATTSNIYAHMLNSTKIEIAETLEKIKSGG